MEPAAPGTEDNFRVVPSNYNKKEQEQERLLSIKTKLHGGHYGNVFEHTVQNGTDHWYCNLCSCPVMGHVYHHEIGKRHSFNMQASNASNVTKSAESDAPEVPIIVATGEPLPPGYEDKDKIAQIQERLDCFTVDPLIGLEYIFELIEDDIDKEPQYLCILCDKRGDPRTVMSHLASFRHILQYLQRHFLTCYRALTPYSGKQYKRSWQITVHKIAEAIESKFGRLKPHVVDKSVFENKKSAFIAMVAKGPHFNERAGFTFEELVVEEEMTRVHGDASAINKPVDEIVKRNYRKTGAKLNNDPKQVATSKTESGKLDCLSGVSSISGSDLSDFDSEQPPSPKRNRLYGQPSHINKNRSSFKRQDYSPVRENRRYVPRRNVNSNYPNKNRNDERAEKPNYRYRAENSPPDHPKNKFDKNSEFTRLAFAIEKDMDRIIAQHQKHPEKHPQYNEEWKKFWNQRYKQLQAEGKNPARHDFKPEWIDYWNKRLKEIHAVELKNKKDALRKRLDLPEEPASICFRITGKKRPSEKSDSKLTPTDSAPDLNSDVIIVGDKDTLSAKNRNRSQSPWETESTRMSRRSQERRSRSRDYRNHSRSSSRRSRSRERSAHHDYPYEQNYYRKEYPEYIKPPRVMRDAGHHPVSSPLLAMHHNQTEPQIDLEDDGDINIVSILRLLTALEEKLGSLGPKVIEMLSRALAMENKEANSSEALLDDDINCVMFETVKEKLKGQLLAGLVSFPQEKAFKIAIKKLASLIHFAGERKKEKEKKKPSIDPILVPGIGQVDKAAIAKQIAAALIVQGKTDVTQGELEQLINAVVGMAEASKASNKPIKTASFLEQLANQKQLPVEPSSASFKSTPSTVTTGPAFADMEGLSDKDLQSLLQNFNDLGSEEQQSLILYLKKLEAREPERVERLRKFVRVEAQPEIIQRDPEVLFEKSDEETDGKISPFANRFAETNPTSDDNLRNKFEITDELKTKDHVTIDSEEEDYSFEDVFKAADKNIRDKEEKEEQKRLSEQSASDLTKESLDVSVAKSLMANIMDQFRSKSDVSVVANPELTAVVPPPKLPVVPLPENFPNTGFLDNININLANLTNALNAAQQIKPNLPKTPFPPQSQSRIQPSQSEISKGPPINNPELPRPYSTLNNPHSNNLFPQKNAPRPPKYDDSNTQYQFRGPKPPFDAFPNQRDHNPARFMANNSNRGNFNKTSYTNRFNPPPVLKNHISPHIGTDTHHGVFNRSSHSNQFEPSSEYYDYENRW